MTRQIKESDWKLFRRLHPVALERFCERVIGEINSATANCTGEYHKRYLEVYGIIRERDKEMGRAFNDMRRSTAIIMITNIRGSDLLTDEEFSQFSPGDARGYRRDTRNPSRMKEAWLNGWATRQNILVKGKLGYAEARRMRAVPGGSQGGPRGVRGEEI